MITSLEDFTHIWCVNFEFGGLDGACPHPRCVVAKEWRTGQTLRWWLDQEAPSLPPYACDAQTLIVAYYASAEMNCHLALGWPLPPYVLDLFAEFRCLTNGRNLRAGSSLLGALSYFGLDAIDAQEKADMQALSLRGGPYTAEERTALLDYCESDTQALRVLLPAMVPHMHIPRALLRGRYMKAAACMETAGIPIDVPLLTRLQHAWPQIEIQLIQAIDHDYGVYDGRSFRTARWEVWCRQQGLTWPRLASGRLDLSKETFKDMATIHPAIQPMKELRASLSQLRLRTLQIGPDGRNRCLLSAFRAITSRNQPSTAKFIFGPAVWMRHLIQPPPGYGLAYVDYEQQEFGVAAVLSNDTAMLMAYRSSDPYIAFAQQAGAAPPGATKETHEAVRNQFKTCALSVQYGMEAPSLALRLGCSQARAAELLRLHRRTYPQFWWWSDNCLDMAMWTGQLLSCFGWSLHVGRRPNPRSLRNWPVQTHGAEMLRLACCYATEAGVRVVAPVSDAVLIEAPLDTLEHDVARMTDCMRQASADVLQGFELRTDVKYFRFPERYSDTRGTKMWQTVNTLLAQCEAGEITSHARAQI